MFVILFVNIKVELVCTLHKVQIDHLKLAVCGGERGDSRSVCGSLQVAKN